MSVKSLVSVIIPTCNRSSVFNAIDSVCAQDYKNLEIIVVNDSPIDTIKNKVLGQYPEIIYFHDGINRGGGGARRKGVEISRGEYICFLDDDDYYFPNKISFLIERLSLDTSTDAYFGKVYRTDKQESLEDKQYKVIKSLSDICFLHTNTSLIRRYVFDEINFDPELKKFQDTYFHILLVTKFKVVFCSKLVAVWNVDNRDDQITRTLNIRDYLNSYRFYKMMVYKLYRQNIGSINILYLYYKLARNFIKTHIIVPWLHVLKHFNR